MHGSYEDESLKREKKDEKKVPLKKVSNTFNCYIYIYEIEEAMTVVKFQRIISFSSEHPNHKVENLISGVASSSGSKKVS